jgi:protein ImuB
MTKSSELYACLYVREFPAQALLRLKSELHDKPCVVMDGDPPFECVCSLNRKARALGIAHGMTQVEIETFSSAVVLSRSRNTEAATRAILLECAGGFSPHVEDQNIDGAFLCVIDIVGTRSLFGPPEVLAQSLRNRVRTLGVTACIAVSSNFHTAVAIAKGLPPGKVVKVVPQGEERASLSSLPVGVLDLTERQAEIFSLWGIRTLGTLAALPEKELIARIGQAGKRLRQLARGEALHFFQPVEPVFKLEERMELDSPVELLDPLLFITNVSLEQLVFRATARILALASVAITLTLEGGGIHVCTTRPAQPSNDRQFWIRMLHLELEAHPPKAAVLALTLTAEPGSTSKVQLGLFSPQMPEPARLDVTLARIRAIVGEENVGRPVLDDTHAPEGFHLAPFVVPSTQSSETTSLPLPSALRQLRPAEAVSVTLQSERPKSFEFRKQRYIVERAYGPWLTAGEWWNPSLWECEQWDLIARAQDGTTLCCCLICDLIEKQWQMVALYD